MTNYTSETDDKPKRPDNPQLLEDYLELLAFRLIWDIDAEERIHELEADLPTEWVSKIGTADRDLGSGVYKAFWSIHVSRGFFLTAGAVFSIGSELSPPLQSECYPVEPGCIFLEEFYFDLMRSRNPEIITPSIYPLENDQWKERAHARVERRKELEASLEIQQKIKSEDLDRAARLPDKTRLMTTHHDLVVKSLRTHTEALALPLGRKVGSPGHAVTREYLLHQMKRRRLEPFHGDSFELTYEMPHPNTKELQEFTNLVGVIRGSDRSLPPILLGAHYDSVIDAPCVDDNATSVALNLAIAEEYTLRPLDRDLIIAFFDAEEPPFFLGKTMGSRRFCEDYCQEIDFAAVIVSDLIGHDFRPTDLSLPSQVDTFAPQFRKLLCVMGAESSPLFPGIVEKAAERSKGLRVFPTLYRYVGKVSDHAAFADAGQPFLFLSCGQGEHYHTPKDTLEWINFEKLGRITAYVADLIEQINAMPRHPKPGPRDSFDVEIRMLRKALGLALPIGLKLLGREVPSSREEMDALVEDAMSSKLK